MPFQSLSHALASFLGQPWGVVGAVCIMFAVTAFNSSGLKSRLRGLGLGEDGMALLLNGFNLVGGACLFVNATQRNEVVWIILEVYFVTVAVKGLWQSRSALRRFWSQAS
jgi:hypothetical protein